MADGTRLVVKQLEIPSGKCVVKGSQALHDLTQT